MKNIVILGSTGSIGTSALKVLEGLGTGYRVLGLSASRNVELLARQVRKFRPRFVSVFDPRFHGALKGALDGFCRELPPGVEGLTELAAHPDADLVLVSVVGAVGLRPLLAALKCGKTVALANKEPMVMAGGLLMEEARKTGATLLPVDSEPSAIFQCLNGSLAGQSGLSGQSRPAVPLQLAGRSVRRVWLTASGGAFYRKKGSLRDVSVRQALKHPTWRMGAKITIDCATLMNKGFEAIEISNLFGLALERISIAIHPQSIVHGAVEFEDGSTLAQMSPPDMRFPIQYALTFPERAARPARSLKLYELSQLTFRRPDFGRFPALRLALEAGRAGGCAPAALNAANEAAVEAFLKGKARFTDIPRVVGRVLAERSLGGGRPTLDEILETDGWARRRAEEFLRTHSL